LISWRQPPSVKEWSNCTRRWIWWPSRRTRESEEKARIYTVCLFSFNLSLRDFPLKVFPKQQNGLYEFQHHNLCALKHRFHLVERAPELDDAHSKQHVDELNVEDILIAW
jgi:hypothetical protein